MKYLSSLRTKVDEEAMIEIAMGGYRFSGFQPIDPKLREVGEVVHG